MGWAKTQPSLEAYLLRYYEHFGQIFVIWVKNKMF